MIQKTINQRFKLIREFLKKNKKLTAAEVADVFGMTYTNYNKIERGKSTPSIGVVISAYNKPELNGLNWMWFIFGEGEMWLDNNQEEVSEPTPDYGHINTLMKQLEYMQRENDRLHLDNEQMKDLIKELRNK